MPSFPLLPLAAEDCLVSKTLTSPLSLSPPDGSREGKNWSIHEHQFVREQQHLSISFQRRERGLARRLLRDELLRHADF